MVLKIGLMLVVYVLLLTIQPSTCSPLENEKLVALSERFDKLQTKMDSLEVENEALKIRVDCLERKDTENEAKIKEQEKEIIQLKTKMEIKLESIQSTGPSRDELTTNLLSSSDNTINSIYRKVESEDSSTRAVVTSSCRELSLIGHSLDGLYLVQNLDTKKIETVFCDFGTSISQDLIGHVDVKSNTVHFYVQRESNFSTVNAVIPFELARLNEGGAFDLNLGIFTAPVNGIYHFDFSALKDRDASNLIIALQVNSGNVGMAYTDQYATGTYNSISLSAFLRLEADDKVRLFKYGGTLYDSSWKLTHFTGWLIEEALM